MYDFDGHLLKSLGVWLRKEVFGYPDRAILIYLAGSAGIKDGLWKQADATRVAGFQSRLLKMWHAGS
jgi:hypothetical protein